MSPYLLVVAAALVVAACTPEQVGLVVDTAGEAAILTGHPGVGYALHCLEAFCAAGGPH